MKNRIKLFFLGYFSNRTVKQAQKLGLRIMFLSIFVSAIILLFGLIGATTLPISFIYRNSKDLCATVEKTFSDVQMTVVDGKIIAGITEQDNQLVVDTVDNEKDRQQYSVNGFDVIVDTRSADLFDDFTAVCVTKNGKEISYEEYCALDSETKSLYTFYVRYSGKERIIDESWKLRCEEYLDTVTDETVAKNYAEVKTLSKDAYPKALYELYVKSYYPDLSRYETGGGAPKLRNSYSHNYSDRKNILFVFDDSVVVRFVARDGQQQVLYGFYSGMQNGDVNKNFSNVHDFLLQSFENANVIVVYSSIINFITITPYLIFISFIVIIIMYCLLRICNKEQMKFGALAKIACNFLLWTVVFTDLIIMTLSLFISQSRLFGVACVVFFAVFLVRAFIFVIGQWRSSRLDTQKQFKANKSEGAV